jgi:hypothetical protein
MRRPGLEESTRKFAELMTIGLHRREHATARRKT